MNSLAMPFEEQRGNFRFDVLGGYMPNVLMTRSPLMVLAVTCDNCYRAVRDNLNEQSR